jgi:hypothetical protein
MTPSQPILKLLISFFVATCFCSTPLAAQPSTNRSLVYNSSPSYLYRWDQSGTWTGGQFADDSSHFVLLGNGVNNFSTQFLSLPGSNVIGGLSRTIGGFDGSGASSAGLYLSGGNGANGILNLAPSQAYQSVLGAGKEIYINGSNAVDTVSNLSSTAELRGNANSSLLNHGTILSSNTYLGVIRNLNVVNSSTGTIRKVGLAQSSIAQCSVPRFLKPHLAKSRLKIPAVGSEETPRSTAA